MDKLADLAGWWSVGLVIQGRGFEPHNRRNEHPTDSGETMVSETVLGVLFCFFLPLAVAARFWHWYTFFKRNQTIKIARQMQNDETELNS